MHHRRIAIIGVLLLIPMALLLPSVIFQIGFIEKALTSVLTTDGQQLNIFGRVFVYGGLLAVPVVLCTNVWVMLRKDGQGKRHFFIANLLVACFALALFIPPAYELGKDVYRCDVLKIPNCD